jgi:translation initiation factor 4E
MVFKKDIPPMWEKPANRDGGRWVLNINRNHRNSNLDQYWLNTLLALIGDQFIDEGPAVNGVWVNVRTRGDKISLWTRNAKDADLQQRIGKRFKEILNLKDGTLSYEKHEQDPDKKADPGIYKC